MRLEEQQEDHHMQQQMQQQLMTVMLFIMRPPPALRPMHVRDTNGDNNNSEMGKSDDSQER